MRCDIKTMQSKIFWVVVVMLGVFVLMQKFQASEGISVQQAQTMNQQGALLLDVREPQEYAEIHAPNATLIPLGELGSRLNEIAPYKDKPIAVVCRSGRRSSKAVQLLKESGYTQVSNVAGGMNAWESAGLTVVHK